MKTESEYQKALKRIEQIQDALPGTPEGEELLRLAILVEEYEEKHFKLPEPDQADIDQYQAEQKGKPYPVQDENHTHDDEQKPSYKQQT